jgi:iron complex outermembrane receptor protein
MIRRTEYRRIATAGRRTAAILLGALAWSAASPALAEETRAFNIGASTPAVALQSFAAQSGVQILASGTRLQGRQLNPVTGELSTDAALQQLLAGSGLGYEYVGERAVALVAVNDPAAARAVPVAFAPAGGRAVLRTASAEGEAGGGAAASSTPATAGFSLEEVVVTARKVRENLQDTPIAVTAFSGDALDDRQIVDTTRLTQVVPNLQFANNAPLAGNNSSSAVFIRGIGQTDPTSTVDPGVGLYIDDVYIGQAVGGTMELRDIDSMQVLRGPQGTLFGRNTIGGAILLSSTEPGDSFGGSVRGGFGSYDLRHALLALDVPMGATLRSRFTAGIRKQNGYVLRPDGTDLGDANSYTLTAKFVWQPAEHFTGRLLYDYARADEHGAPLVFAAINEAATFPKVASRDAGCPGYTSIAVPVPMIDDPRCANDFQGRGPFANNGTNPLTSQLKNWGASLNLAYEATDALTLKSVTAYRNLWWLGNRDADNTPLTILNTYYDSQGSQWSQELQLTYQSARLTGVVGAFYFKQKSDDIATVDLNPPPPGVQHDSDNNVVDNWSWAAFTQWTWRATDALAVTVGGRYTHDEKGSYPDQFDYSAPGVKQVPVQWYRDTFTSFTPSASVNYRWSPQAMTYLSYSEGFKGGGWNSHFNSVLTDYFTLEQIRTFQEFKPEEARTYELGAKFDLLQNTLRLNAALFSSDYTDMQLTYRGPIFPPPTPPGVAPFVTNAGKASIKGAELEVTWAPTAALRAEASVGYLDARIDRLDDKPLVLHPGLVAGNVLPYAPKWQGHLGLAYTAHGGGWAITPRVDAAYQSATYFDATDTPEIAQLGGYTVLNAQVVFKREAEQRIGVTVGVNNATDKIYRVAGNSSLSTGSGYAETAYARPRVYFATLSYDF